MFDSYVEGSIKDSERIRSEGEASIEVNSIYYDASLPIEIDRF